MCAFDGLYSSNEQKTSVNYIDVCSSNWARITAFLWQLSLVTRQNNREVDLQLCSFYTPLVKWYKGLRSAKPHFFKFHKILFILLVLVDTMSVGILSAPLYRYEHFHWFIHPTGVAYSRHLAINLLKSGLYLSGIMRFNPCRKWPI